MADDRGSPEVRREWRRRGLQTAIFVGATLILILVVLLSTLVQRSRRAAEQRNATATAQVWATGTAMVVQAEATGTALVQHRATVEVRATVMATTWAESFPIRAGTPVPRPVEAISAATVPMLVELARWGQGWISEIAWSHDGRLVVGTSTGIFWYDAPIFTETHAIEFPGGAYSMALSPDGALVAAIGSNGKLSLWEEATGRQIATLGEHLLDVIFSPDGAVLAAGTWDGTVQLWDVETLAQRSLLLGVHSDVFKLAFSPDGALLAIAVGEEGNIWLVDPATGQEIATLQGRNPGLRDLVFSPDGIFLLTAPPFQLWEVATREERPLPPGLDEAASNAILSSDGTRLATSTADGTVQIWDLATGQEVRVLELDRERILYLSFSPDGAILATIEGGGNTIRVGKLETGEEIAVLDEYTAPVNAVALSPDGTLLATGTWNGRVQIRDVATGSVQSVLPSNAFPVGNLAFTPDGALLIASTGGRPSRRTGQVDRPGGIYIWDLRTGQEIPVPENDREAVYGTALSPDGTLLATTVCRKKEVQSDGAIMCRNNQVVWWDLAALRGAQPTVVTGTLDADGISPGNLAFSPGGTLLAAGTEAGAIYLWEVGTWQNVQVIEKLLQTVDNLAFSPDGMNLASTVLYGDDVYLWDVRTGELAQEFSLSQFGISSGLAFSPDGSLLAVGTWEGTHLVEIEPAENVTRVPAAYGKSIVVLGLAFTPDGTLLATAGWDGTVRLWGIPP